MPVCPCGLSLPGARGCKVATYAAGDTDFAVDLRATEAMGTVTMAFGSETLRLELKMAGRHAVHDAAAAAAAAVAVGVNSRAVEAGLRSFEPVGRPRAAPRAQKPARSSLMTRITPIPTVCAPPLIC